MSENSVFDPALLLITSGMLYAWILFKSFAFLYLPPLSSGSEQSKSSLHRPNPQPGAFSTQSRQDPESGSWAADSMNKKYEPDSIPARFMRDAATAFAALALLDADLKN